MNPTSRAFLQTILTTDTSLAQTERDTFQRLIDGTLGEAGMSDGGTAELLAVTQKAAARAINVSRVTIWRMARDGLLHPIEILPGVWRYPFSELAALVRSDARQPETQRRVCDA